MKRDDVMRWDKIRNGEIKFSLLDDFIKGTNLIKCKELLSFFNG